MYLKMNIIASLLFTVINGYEIINGIIPYQKKYYISSKITDNHKLWINDAINILDLETQDYYDSNCIRIRYSDLRYTGFTDFEGYLNSNNKWMIDKISVGVNPNIQFYNTFVLVMLHELLHTVGCFHSDVPNSIMNVSILVVNGEVQDVPFPILHQDDINCLQKLNFFLKKNFRLV